MSTKSQDRRAVLAACAVALATAVGSNGAAVAQQSSAIEQLERYCATSWKNAGIRRDQWDDCTQQALVELLEEISREGLPAAIDNSQSIERRELNRAVWRLVQRCRRAPRLASFDERKDCPPVNYDGDESGEPRWSHVADVASDLLTKRQLQILELVREGWRVADIASELGISAERVSDEKYKAIAKLRHRFLGSSLG